MIHLTRNAIAIGLSSSMLLATAVVAEAGDAVELIDRDVFFGNPDRAGVRISPDGARLGFLAPVEGVMNVWVGPSDDWRAARPITDDDDRGIRTFFWAPSGTHLVYVQDSDGDENYHAYSVDVRSGEVLDLTPIDGVRAQISAVGREFPNHILVGLNDRDPRLHDLWKVDVRTGDRELVLENPEYLGFVIDEQFRVRFGVSYTRDGGRSYDRISADGSVIEPFLVVGPEDGETTTIAGLDKSGERAYLVDSRDRNTAALFLLDVESGDRTLLFEHPRADVSDVMINPVTLNVEAVAANYTREEWTILDETIGADFERLRGVRDGEIIVMSRTLDDTKWIIGFTVADGPVAYYVYDRASGETRFLFTSRSVLESLPLADMHPVVVESRDGLELVSYLTLPVWADEDGDARPSEPLPTVLLVHGGPWGRDAWGYDPWHQWLANRGYAVLSVNFRGSTGFGKDFLNAGNGQWADAMHDDLVDAVTWAVAEGVADEKRVAIMGGSYGGYAALAGLTYTPEVFTCGVDIVGPSNLITLLNSIPPYWEPLIAMFTKRVADHRTPEGRRKLRDMSPLTQVDEIVRPLLIGQGANDPRVKQAESDQIVRSMRDRNLPVTYVLFPDEGHGFARPENSKAFNAIVEVFLAKHLGGRYQPIGDEIEASSAQVLSRGDLELPVEEAGP